MNSHDTMLGRITSARGSTAPSPEPPPRGYRRSHADIDLVAQFSSRATDYGATVVVTDTPRTAIADLLAVRGGSTFVIPAGFPEEWAPDGAFTVRTDPPPLSVDELDGVDGVITTAALAIAVTGTLVLDSGPGQGRRALTLLPDHHLCVLRARDVVGDIPEALARLNPRAPLTFISGPSATSDIELDRVEGVHGPRSLDIVIVP